MKKLTLLLLVLLMFTACGKSEKERETTPPYFFTYSQKINAITGAVTPVCTDPLCPHDEFDCPFYGMATNSSFTVMDGHELIYDVTLPAEEKTLNGPYTGTYTYFIFYYNIDTNELRTIYELGLGNTYHMTTSTYYYNRHIFMQQMIHDEESGKDVPTNLMINIDTKEQSTIILPEATADVRAIEGDTLYFFSSDTSKFYQSDIDGSNAVEISINDLPTSIADDGNRYYHNKADVNYSLVRRDDKDNEHLLLEGNCGPHFVHDGWIYYTEQTADPVVVGTDTEGNPLTTNARHIWRISTDGKTKEIVYENDGLHGFSRLDMVMKSAGDYVGIQCNLYKVENGEIVNLYDDSHMRGFLIINGKTGETKCVEYSTNITRDF